MTTHYAHTLPPPKTRDDWEPRSDHLVRVAEGDGKSLRGAADFAESFGAADWGRLLGLWHDLGKYSAEFQQYLGQSGSGDPHALEIHQRIDHSTAGAQHAAAKGKAGLLLAYAIAGHHAGLPDDTGGDGSLAMRLKKLVAPYSAAPADLLNLPLPPPPKLRLGGDKRRAAFSVAFLTRMLFSCLVDADFLATEWFMDAERSARRPQTSPPLADLLSRLDVHLGKKKARAPDSPVNRVRHDVLADCRAKSALPPGLFSLNVPTGGGKTLSSLAFALTHAASHGLRRVVYAIPFTSIIEQTASVFREALSDPAAEDDPAAIVLEHHSSLDPDDPKKQSERSRLAAENFDAPVVVTTNVQLFESLFACRTSRCRKLHRLARSVIILDEAQSLPPNLLAPTLAALDELARNYGSTVVLCTATQPAIERRERFTIGLENVTPIIDDPHALHGALRRTRVEPAGLLTDEELAARLAIERQVLCIVNSRRHAADLFRRLDGPDALHLSALMCAAHRTKVVKEIKRRLDLKVNEPCRVVSTQVIEAGVDVDFPAVYRAAAGLDSIAQAAGRCNREGRLTDESGRPRLGRVVVFDYDEQSHHPPPFARRAAAHFREIAPDHLSDLLAPAAIEAYFRLHYWQQGGEDGRGWDEGRDKQSVMLCFGGEDGDPAHHQFREAADHYRLIDDAQTPVLVPYGKGRRLRRELESLPEPADPQRLRGFDRRAQRYVVGVRDYALLKLLENGVLLQRHGRYYLANDAAYDEKLGLTFDAVGLNENYWIA